MKKTLQISIVSLVFFGIVCSFLVDAWPVMKFVTPALLWSAAALFVLLMVITEVKAQRKRRAEAAQAATPSARASGPVPPAASREVIALLTEQTQKLSTLRENTSDPVLGGKLGAAHRTLRDVLAFLGHEPGTAGKLRSMAKHYLPDFLEAVTFYDRTKDYGFIDPGKYYRYIDTMTGQLTTVLQQICEHKDLAIDINMEITESLLAATGILEQRRRVAEQAT